jgi:pilus assembly protein CpaB
MNSRAFTLSLLIAGIAVFMVNSYIEGREAVFKDKYGTEVPVVVAKVDIKELELIDDRKVMTISVPKKYRMNGAFEKQDHLYNTIAAVPIKKGEQITKPRVTYPGARSGLSRQVSIGKRAMSVQVSEGQAVSKLIKPGDRIDRLCRWEKGKTKSKNSSSRCLCSCHRFERYKRDTIDRYESRQRNS